MPSSFNIAITPPDDLNQPALWFLFQGHRLLIDTTDERGHIPLGTSPTSFGLHAIRQQYLGFWDDNGKLTHCFCGEIATDIEAPPGYTWESLRPLYPLLDEKLFWLAGLAIQIVDWDRTHQYCGRCGHETVNSDRERAKICPQCGLVSYPRLDPAIIVRIQRQTANGSEILLARAKRFPTAMFSVLAGFVEPGESLEECVEREIKEEVGITVHNIRYFGSQPWPFPHSLMIAFTADYDNGEMAADHKELAEASWFSPDHLPTIPSPPSIANRLITSWSRENSKA